MLPGSQPQRQSAPLHVEKHLREMSIHHPDGQPGLSAPFLQPTGQKRRKEAVCKQVEGDKMRSSRSFLSPRRDSTTRTVRTILCTTVTLRRTRSTVQKWGLNPAGFTFTANGVTGRKRSTGGRSRPTVRSKLSRLWSMLKTNGNAVRQQILPRVAKGHRHRSKVL